MVQTAKEGTPICPSSFGTLKMANSKATTAICRKRANRRYSANICASLPHEGRGVGSVTAEMMDAIRACI